MTHWIIKKVQSFTDVELLKISGSVRSHAYLILSSQISARSRIIGNMANALTAQKAFLNNFKNHESQSRHSERHQTLSRHS